MIQIRDLQLPLGYDDKRLRAAAAHRLGVLLPDVHNVQLLRRSVDARKKDKLRFVLTVAAEVTDENAVLKRLAADHTVSRFIPYVYAPAVQGKLSLRQRPVVVGSGPAGLFAALLLAQHGAAPLLLERGLPLTERKAAVAAFWNGGVLDPACNVQFGEGGAGTFSDGKLNTGIKDMRARHVLETFVACGAPKEILVEAKPHIGTDKLCGTITALREKIIALGGEVRFGARFCDFSTTDGKIASVTFAQNGTEATVPASHLVLAVGHSARDVFALLQEKGVALAQKSFAVGMRIEHLQRELDRSLYGKFAGHPALHAADYKLVTHLPNGQSLYTFCMCPGGQVVAAASEAGQLVTNGMSNFARDGENANSALLVGIPPEAFGSTDPLAGVAFQRRLEEAAFTAGGGDYHAPVCLVGDFLQHRVSTTLGRVKPTYRPGFRFAAPEQYLPDFVTDTLRLGLPRLGRLLAGFDAEDAVLTGVESRSSSPVRILRGTDGMSVSHPGLYPCGEGAGYAGGIVSAAVDGLRCAEAILSSTDA